MEEHNATNKANCITGIESILAEIFVKKDDDIWLFLEKLRMEAEKKGFSDHVLDEILNDK